MGQTSTIPSQVYTLDPHGHHLTLEPASLPPNQVQVTVTEGPEENTKLQLEVPLLVYCTTTTRAEMTKAHRVKTDHFQSHTKFVPLGTLQHCMH